MTPLVQSFINDLKNETYMRRYNDILQTAALRNHTDVRIDLHKFHIAFGIVKSLWKSHTVGHELYLLQVRFLIIITWLSLSMPQQKLEATDIKLQYIADNTSAS